MSDSCDPMDCTLPGSSVNGILQARILDWVTISISRGSSQPRDWTWVFCIAGRFFTNLATKERKKESIQSCPTPCDPMDCSLPGSSVHGILQSRILEWVAISFFRVLANPGLPHCGQTVNHLRPPGKPDLAMGYP